MVVETEYGNQFRYTLAKSGFYGDPDLELQILFNRAHVDFRAWARQNKIYSVQRNFKYGLEPLLWTWIFEIYF